MNIKTKAQMLVRLAMINKAIKKVTDNPMIQTDYPNSMVYLEHAKDLLLEVAKDLPND